MYIIEVDAAKLSAILDAVVKVFTIASGVVLAYLTYLGTKNGKKIDDVKTDADVRGTKLDQIKELGEQTQVLVNGHRLELERQVRELRAAMAANGVAIPQIAEPQV